MKKFASIVEKRDVEKRDVEKGDVEKGDVMGIWKKGFCEVDVARLS